MSTSVEAWLDEHPEATTTVTDGSVTFKKLSDNVVKEIKGSRMISGKTASFYGDSLTEVNYHYSKGYYQWVNLPFWYSSIDNYESGNSAAYGEEVMPTINDNTVTIGGTISSRSNEYAAIMLPLLANTGTLPYDIQLTNTKMFINGVSKKIVAVGTYKDNSGGTYATINGESFLRR